MPPRRSPPRSRTEFGKGAARRIRRDDKIPAVVYGHGNDPIHVTLPGHDTMMALKHGGANALLELDIEGKSQLALTKQVQVDPIRRRPRAHRLRRRPQAARRSPSTSRSTWSARPPRETLVVTENSTVQVEAEATNIPEFIEVSIEGADGRHPDPRLRPRAARGHHAADRPRDAGRQRHPARRPPRQLEAELAEAEAEAGIEREESDEEVAEAEAAAAEGEAAEGESADEGAPTRSDPAALGHPLKRARAGIPTMTDDRRPTCGSSSGWATPGRPTPGTGTTSATSSTDELAAPDGRAVPRPQVRPRRRGRGPAGAARARPARASCWPGRARYMNETGGPVKALATFYKVPPERIVAVHDELDIPFGTLRVKLGGGDNGHNGLRSMRASLGTGDFYRVRVGIGRPPGRQDVADFVLSNYSAAERKELPFQVDHAADAVESPRHRGPRAHPAALQLAEPVAVARVTGRDFRTRHPARRGRHRRPRPRRLAATVAGERLLEVRGEGLEGRELKDAGDLAAHELLMAAAAPSTGPDDAVLSEEGKDDKARLDGAAGSGSSTRSTAPGSSPSRRATTGRSTSRCGRTAS